jgi:predicted membrane GTPase involved in stress response
MELFRNEFYCKECGKVGFADSVDAIIKRKKLCSKCFCKSLGFEEEIEKEEKAEMHTSRKVNDMVTQELKSHTSLRREPVKKKVKHKKEGRGWNW